MVSAEAGRNEAFKNYKRLFLTCIAKKLCSENLFSSSILHLKRCRRHDFRPTRHLVRTYFGEGSKNVFLKFRQNQLTDRNGRPIYSWDQIKNDDTIFRAVNSPKALEKFVWKIYLSKSRTEETKGYESLLCFRLLLGHDEIRCLGSLYHFSRVWWWT